MANYGSKARVSSAMDQGAGGAYNGNTGTLFGAQGLLFGSNEMAAMSGLSATGNLGHVGGSLVMNDNDWSNGAGITMDPSLWTDGVNTSGYELGGATPHRRDFADGFNGRGDGPFPNFDGVRSGPNLMYQTGEVGFNSGVDGSGSMMFAELQRQKLFEFEQLRMQQRELLATQNAGGRFQQQQSQLQQQPNPQQQHQQLQLQLQLQQLQHLMQQQQQQPQQPQPQPQPQLQKGKGKEKETEKERAPRFTAPPAAKRPRTDGTFVGILAGAPQAVVPAARQHDGRVPQAKREDSTDSTMDKLFLVLSAAAGDTGVNSGSNSMEELHSGGSGWWNNQTFPEQRVNGFDLSESEKIQPYHDDLGAECFKGGDMEDENAHDVSDKGKWRSGDGAGKRPYGVSCQRCRKLKKKCDTKIPCSKCVAHSAAAALVCGRESEGAVVTVDVQKMRHMSQLSKLTLYMDGYANISSLFPSIFVGILQESVKDLFLRYNHSLRMAESSDVVQFRLTQNEKFCVKVLTAIGAKVIGHSKEGDLILSSLSQKPSMEIISSPSVWSLYALLELVSANNSSDVVMANVYAGIALSHVKFVKFVDSSARDSIVGRTVYRQVLIDPSASAEEKWDSLTELRVKMGWTREFETARADKNLKAYLVGLMTYVVNPLLYKLLIFSGLAPFKGLYDELREDLRRTCPEDAHRMLDLTMLGEEFVDPSSPSFVSPPPRDVAIAKLKVELDALTKLDEDMHKYLTDNNLSADDKNLGMCFHILQYSTHTLAMSFAEASGDLACAMEHADIALKEFAIAESPLHTPVSLSFLALLAAFFCRHNMLAHLTRFRNRLVVSMVYPDPRRISFAVVLDLQIQRLKRLTL